MNSGRVPSSTPADSSRPWARAATPNGDSDSDSNIDSPGGGHDGAGMMRWLLTYADLITLLMAFFIVMYALSRVDLSRYQKLAASLQGVLGYGAGKGGGGGGSGLGGGLGPGLGSGELSGTGFFAPAPDEVPISPPSSAKTQASGAPAESAVAEGHLAELEKAVQSVAHALKASGLVRVKIQSEGMSVLISDVALFPTASAQLTPRAHEILRKLAPSLRSLPNLLQIRGYTDNVPIRTAQFPSNWELSLARSVSVLRALVEAGVPVQRLSAAGFGPLNPVAPNETAAGRARNRRVEIVVLQQPARQPTVPPTTPDRSHPAADLPSGPR